MVILAEKITFNIFQHKELKDTHIPPPHTHTQKQNLNLAATLLIEASIYA